MKMLISWAVALAALLAQPAWAQKSFDPENRPVEIVVAFAPGGGGYNIALLISQIMKDHGWQAMVSSKPGGNQTIAANYVASAKPDGHTLFLTGVGSVVINMAFPEELQGAAKYDEKSWEHITLLNRSDLGIVVNADGPIKTYEDLKKFVRANPKQFNIGTWNPALGKLFVEWARKEKLPEPTVVIYKGSAPALVDVAGGQILMAFDNVGWGAPMLQHVESGKLRVLALMDGNISKTGRKWATENKQIVNIGRMYPELRTGAFIGFSAPAGTPRETINLINELVRKAASDPRYRDRIAEIDGWGSSPAEYDAFVKTELEKFKRVKAQFK